MDSSLASQWGIPAIPVPEPIPARSLNGSLITTVSYATPPVNLIVSGNHREVTTLYLLESPSAPTRGWCSMVLTWIGPAILFCRGASLVLRLVWVLPLFLCLCVLFSR